MFTYDTPSQAINNLIKRGYTVDFNVNKVRDTIIAGGIITEGKVAELSPEEFEIDEIYRFEGDSDPGDETVVYAISSRTGNLKGLLVDAFGPYSSSEASKVVRMLSAHIEHHPQHN
jgi:hypothetical protein